MSSFVDPNSHNENGMPASHPIITGIITVVGLLLKTINHSTDDPLLKGEDPKKYIDY